MATKKVCATCTAENAGRHSIYGTNCRRRLEYWADRRIKDVIKYSERLNSWQGTLSVRLEEAEKKEHVHVLKKRAA